MSECEICKKSGLGDLLGSKENGEKMYHSWCMLKLMSQQSAKGNEDIAVFVTAMKAQLEANKSRNPTGDWRNWDGAVDEVPAFIQHNLRDIESERPSLAKKQQQCVDIANFALMMWYQLKALSALPEGE